MHLGVLILPKLAVPKELLTLSASVGECDGVGRATELWSPRSAWLGLWARGWGEGAAFLLLASPWLAMLGAGRQHLARALCAGRGGSRREQDFPAKCWRFLLSSSSLVF